MKSAKEIVKKIVRAPAENLLKVYLAALPAEQFEREKINRILVFAYHGLGNFIMYTPALRALRERYPNARIDLQVGNNTGCEEVLAGAGLFDNIYNLPYRAGLRAWIKRAREVRAARYDLTINEFHSHSWPLALLVVASGAPFRLGHITSPGWSHRFSRYSFVFNLPVAMREDEHEIERYLDLVAAVGGRKPELAEAHTFIHLTGEDRRFARKFLEDGAQQASSIVIGFQPGTSPAMRWKQWPIERYREVIERLMNDWPQSRIILFGSPSETEMIQEMARGLGSRVAIAAGKTTVKQAAALIEQCDMLVCNDSGLMHAAVAVGTPVVAIYGPTDIRRTAPLGPRHTVIRHEIECSPCFKLEGDDQVHKCPHHDCLMTITPGEVYQIVKQVSRLRSAGHDRSNEACEAQGLAQPG
ncbi:MAG TPA: lipopolysaccharide heptosyltransferase II [Blastocatellia bacterium]|nr:lipopolysaccharide heptosyltransferase II [Blastocatellia bacterium]